METGIPKDKSKSCEEERGSTTYISFIAFDKKKYLNMLSEYLLQHLSVHKALQRKNVVFLVPYKHRPNIIDG